MEKKTCLLIILLLLTSILAGCINEEDDKQFITAYNGFKQANKIAENWSSNSTLIGVRIASTEGSEGAFKAWWYTFIDTSQILPESKCIEVKILSDNSTSIREDAEIGPRSIIENWHIDSDEAYEIATMNESIKEFLSKHSRASVSGFTLFGGGSESDPAWRIGWSYFGGMFDDPVHAGIRINARTGEVI